MSRLRLHMDCSEDNCLVGDPSPCILFLAPIDEEGPLEPNFLVIQEET